MNIRIKTLVIFLLSIIVIFGIVMIVVEPETFTSFFTSLWWVLTTLTTVGYGDIYPQTTIGSFFGLILMVSGVGIFVLLIRELTTKTMDMLSRKSKGGIAFKKQQHILICCNNPRIVKETIEEYLKDIPEKIPHFVVIANT